MMTRCWLRLGCGAGIAIIAGACSAAAPQLPPPPPELLSSRLDDQGLRPNDVIEVLVFGEKELSGKFQVSEQGTMDYPLVGRVDVMGLTPPDVTDILRRRLGAGFLRNPQVSVFVADYGAKKRVHVWGQVQRSGTFSYTYQMSVIEAVTLAGGTLPLADKTFHITRLEDGESRTYYIHASKSAQVYLQPGDVVYVPERVF